MKPVSILFISILLILLSCSGKNPPAVSDSAAETTADDKVSPSDADPEVIRNILPPEASGDTREFLGLAAGMLMMPAGCLELVDKTHPLSEDFKPDDPVDLSTCPELSVGRNGLILDKKAAEALSRMSRAALADGVTLLISSAYRSYGYQKALFSRYAERDGEEAASRYSARAGTSQHQLGTTVDFGSISDSFAESDAGIWMTEHAGDFGWSLSYPRGYEKETGYRWESWHWRWIGRDAVMMQEKYFNGIQQRLLEYWHENAPEIEELLEKDR
jgi:D-alanyl-D-alanine carboxypeptidase